MDSRLKSSRSRPRLRVVAPPDWPPRADPRPPPPGPKRPRRFRIGVAGVVHELQCELSREKPTNPGAAAVYDPDWRLWIALRVGGRLE